MNTENKTDRRHIGGNTGKFQHGKKTDSRLNICVLTEFKSAWVKAAQRDGYRNMTAGVIAVLNAWAKEFLHDK